MQNCSLILLFNLFSTDEGYRRPAVRSCVLALKSILEVIGEIDVKKLNKVVLEENETRCSDLEDELGNLESLLLIEDQKEDESEDESEAGASSTILCVTIGESILRLRAITCRLKSTFSPFG
ncbi:5956_t:CDS:2 [Entrophospora sp. SA101]|nr:5956_t:CDS:2 [Entrophospora sp. SA101]